MNIKDFYQIFLQSSNTVIDSRKVQRGSVFFAFSGDTFNAAEKSSEALENGAIAVIVEDENYNFPKKNIFFSVKILLYYNFEIFAETFFLFADRKYPAVSD